MNVQSDDRHMKSGVSAWHTLGQRESERERMGKKCVCIQNMFLILLFLSSTPKKGMQWNATKCYIMDLFQWKTKYISLKMNKKEPRIIVIYWWVVFFEQHSSTTATAWLVFSGSSTRRAGYRWHTTWPYKVLFFCCLSLALCGRLCSVFGLRQGDEASARARTTTSTACDDDSLSDRNPFKASFHAVERVLFMTDLTLWLESRRMRVCVWEIFPYISLMRWTFPTGARRWREFIQNNNMVRLRRGIKHEGHTHVHSERENRLEFLLLDSFFFLSLSLSSIIWYTRFLSLFILYRVI